MNPANDWIDQARRVLDALRGGLGEPVPTPEDGTSAAHSADCRWCPVCQAAAVIRGERPEVTAALADVLTATATALRTFAAATGEPTTAPETPTASDAGSEDAGSEDAGSEDAGSEGAGSEGAGDPPPEVQRIEIA